MDTIANLITSIHNAEMAKNNTTQVPYSKVSLAVLAVLQKNGYVNSYEVSTTEAGHKVIVINLSPSVHIYKRTSKPGRRVYVSATEIPVLKQGMGLTVISTSKGLMSGKEAKKQGVGGEVICTAY